MLGDEKTPIILSDDEESDGKTMDLDSEQSNSSGDEAFEQDWGRRWDHLLMRWRREGVPGHMPFARLLRTLETDEKEDSWPATRGVPIPPGDLQGGRTEERQLLPEGPPAVRDLRDPTEHGEALAPTRRRVLARSNGLRNATSTTQGEVARRLFD